MARPQTQNKMFTRPSPTVTEHFLRLLVLEERSHFVARPSARGRDPGPSSFASGAVPSDTSQPARDHYVGRFGGNRAEIIGSIRNTGYGRFRCIRSARARAPGPRAVAASDAAA